MTTSGEPHPAAEGLLGSGYVVSMVRPSTPIEAHLGDDDLIYVVLPGSPCQVLIGFLPQGAENFSTMLSEQLRALADRQDQNR
ncbi:hypothetical protein ACFOWZ_44480 [Lentzea rhizosphaerae]|uniref:Uncharacterized protein n=1 Tax=Lentzea rhizosphaerae TaxID=2041025 RepID=A0ABV8C947_9PSEU